jgi:enoyl-CoA hydratase
MNPFSWTTSGSVAVLTFDDGRVNAVTKDEFEALERALDEVNQSECRALVMTGRPGYFSAGLNLKKMATAPMSEITGWVAAMGHAVLKLFLFDKPVVAAVNGHALGAGAMFALASDVRFFARVDSKFGLNEVPAGLFVPTYALELARASAPAESLTELCIHGRVLTPIEAASLKIAEQVCTPETLLEKSIERANALGSLSGFGYAKTKQLLRGPAAAMATQKMPEEIAALVSFFEKKMSA